MTSASGTFGGNQGSGTASTGSPDEAPVDPQASPARAPSRSAVGLLDSPIMAARDVGVGFGAKKVLSDIDLAFTPQTITALIGPTGCGKSTFLRSLNRMNDNVRGYWRTGTIELEGVEISGRDLDPLVLRRRVGMVFQRPNPFPMSIRDNVVAGVRAHRLAPRGEHTDIAERCLREVGLWAPVADRRPRRHHRDLWGVST